jgi:glycosyltransferase involved in cell wall biosynthesis
VAADLSSSDPAPTRFTVVVPTLGRDDLLNALLDVLTSQTLDRSRWDLVVSFDGVEPSPAIASRLASMGAASVTSAARQGPGAARNRGARQAAGDVLAFTEDDCAPQPDWLSRAAARFDREADLDVLEGATVDPAGRPTRRPDGQRPHYLPTNLFVRRSVFEQIGGYCEAFFRPVSGVYFREDSDFGFTLEEAGARAALEPKARVVHPREHPRFLDPIRWARRYEMDALLRNRHPERFHERIEVSHAGPFRIRRPFVRACHAYVLALLAAVIATIAGEEGLTACLLVIAGLTLVAVWAKWGFAPLRLPVLPVVPIVLVVSEAQGWLRANKIARTAA